MAPVTGASVLAQLPSTGGCAVVRDGDATIVACAPERVRTASGEAAFALLDDAGRDGFWVGALAYDLGRTVERVHTRIADDLGIPDVVLARYDARLVLRPGAEPEIVGDGAQAGVLAQAAWRAQRAELPPFHGLHATWTSSLDRVAHRDALAAVLELLEAGECYQVNLTRRLTTLDAADPVGLYLALDASNPAPHAALCTFGPGGPDLAIVSASPELFLRVEGRAVTTRPIKGTAVDRAWLERSGKDHAENVMIVDLARNDLGRVCEYGTISVPELCAVEAHPGLHHLVSTVIGRLRPDGRDRGARPGDVPARVGDRCAEAARAAGDRGPRTGPPGRLLRRDRLDRRRRRARRARRRDPNVHRSQATRPVSVSEAGSSPTRAPTPSGPRPS